jgi:hypothetical protein
MTNKKKSSINEATKNKVKTSTNDITGDVLRSKVANKNYRDNFEKIFKIRKS